jgi:hypothetical protein
MRRRPRIAVAENVIRGLIGEPQLAPVRGPIIRPLGIAHERDIAAPVVLRLGPAVVRSSASLELSVGRAEGGAIEIEVPDTPEHKAAALSVAATGMMLGGWLAEVALNGTGYVVIGAVAGWWGGARLWNRWVRESRGS